MYVRVFVTCSKTHFWAFYAPVIAVNIYAYFIQYVRTSYAFTWFHLNSSRDADGVSVGDKLSTRVEHFHEQIRKSYLSLLLFRMRANVKEKHQMNDNLNSHQKHLKRVQVWSVVRMKKRENTILSILWALHIHCTSSSAIAKYTFGMPCWIAQTMHTIDFICKL